MVSIPNMAKIRLHFGGIGPAGERMGVRKTMAIAKVKTLKASIARRQHPVCGNFHVWECGLYYEIIDPVSGKELPDGQTGELVVTTLDRRAMPLIRYRTGDITKILPQSGCGSKLKTIERVHDRPEKKHLSGQ